MQRARVSEETGGLWRIAGMATQAAGWGLRRLGEPRRREARTGARRLGFASQYLRPSRHWGVTPSRGVPGRIVIRALSLMEVTEPISSVCVNSVIVMETESAK